MKPMTTAKQLETSELKSPTARLQTALAAVSSISSVR